MRKTGLMAFIILLAAALTHAGSDTAGQGPGAATAVSSPPAAPVVKTSGPDMTVKTPGAEPEAAAPATDKDRKAGTPAPGAAVSTPPGGRPVAIVETNTYTFPAVMEGEEVKHDFVIRNKGDAPLIIDKVSAG